MWEGGKEAEPRRINIRMVQVHRVKVCVIAQLCRNRDQRDQKLREGGGWTIKKQKPKSQTCRGKNGERGSKAASYSQKKKKTARKKSLDERHADAADSG